MTEIEKGAYERRIAEVKEAFDYAEQMALAALSKKTVRMSFTISFDEGYVPMVTHDITEYYI
jgi:hypothetical protein